ncbi:MAG: GIY-YIG nuclease family protein [Ignavibacteriae bacterium]|nr:GIY-YIG nuclease family protein [Ignavibacteriota bacterium]
MTNQYFVYILTNKNRTVLYTGITNNLQRRIYEHKNSLIKGFTKKYNLDELVFYEETIDVKVAIAREKQIKAGSREKKIKLIEATNPKWDDLAEKLGLL